MRFLGVPAVVLAAGLLLAGCETGSSTGGLPTPVDDDGSTTAAATPSPTRTPTSPRETSPAGPVSPARKAPAAQVTVVPGAFADNPAVRGLVAKYPVYFRALVRLDADIVKANFPAFFYADTANLIADAKAAGWVMKPPGSVVVVGVDAQPYGVVRVRVCRSQRTQYWNPKARKWVRTTPRGAPEAFDMIERGDGWTMYRWVQPAPAASSCATVRYPA